MQDIHALRKQRFCEIAQLIKPIIGKYDGAFLKLLNYTENESPSDVDIFIPSKNVLKMLKDFALRLNAKFIKRRRFLASSIEAVLPKDINELLHIDLYLECVFTPSYRFTSLPSRTYARVSWCREYLEVPAPSRGFQAFFIMWHSLRHQTLSPKELRTLIALFESFNSKDLAEFLSHISSSKLEVELGIMLYVLLMEAPKISYRALNKIVTAAKYLHTCTRNWGILTHALLHCIIAKSKIVNGIRSYNLKLLNILKILRDISRVSKAENLYYLMRFLFTLFVREYIILLLLKLGILK